MAKKWYIVYIKHSRNIKSLEEVLRDIDCEIWTPTYKFINIEGGEVTEERIQLFPGYAFVNFDYEHYSSVGLQIEDHHIGYILDEGKVKLGARDRRGSPVALKEEELEAVRSMEIEHIEKTEGVVYKEGSVVKIEKGAFVGFEGKILQISGDQVKLEVYVFGRPAPVTLKIEDLGKIQRNI